MLNQVHKSPISMLFSLSTSKEVAGEHFNVVKNMSDRFGTSFDSDVVNYSRFVATSIGLGYNRPEYTPIYTSIFWACVNHKLDSLHISNVFKAFCEMMCRGILTYRELDQISEYFPRVFHLCSSIIDEDPATCVEMIRNQKVLIKPILGELSHNILVLSLEAT